MRDDELLDLLSSPERLRERIAERLQRTANRPLDLAAGDEGAREVRWPAAVLAPWCPAKKDLECCSRAARRISPITRDRSVFPAGGWSPKIPVRWRQLCAKPRKRSGSRRSGCKCWARCRLTSPSRATRITPSSAGVEDPGELAPRSVRGCRGVHRTFVARARSAPLRASLAGIRSRPSPLLGRSLAAVFHLGATAAMLRMFLELIRGKEE